MRFYNRETETAKLREIRTLSYEDHSRLTVLTGRRRIGKTSLILRAMEDEPLVYLFVGRKNEASLCAGYCKEIAAKLGLFVPPMTSFQDVFTFLMQQGESRRFTLVVDEFQEFFNINPSVYSDVQNIWDQYRLKTHVNFIVSGSIYSLMVKIFQNYHEPLFGRADIIMKLTPFALPVLKQILAEHVPGYTNDDLLALYTVTGGIPKYIAQLVEAGAVTREGMIGQVTQPDSPFLGEGRELLVSEFGREHGTYFAILQLIAAGKNTQAEIDSIVGKNTGAYLSNLESEYSLVSRIRPMFASPQSRKTRWAIHDNYLRWWFHFIYPRQALVEMGRMDLLRESIEAGYEQYSGLVLEKYFREKVMAQGRFTDVGGFWDSKGENEIDLIALNDLDKTALVAEVKRNPRKINLQTLARKAEALRRELAKYRVELRGFSLEDM